MIASMVHVLRHLYSPAIVAAALVLPSTPAGAADAPPSSVPSPTIDTIVVTAQKLSVETKIDRKVYTVADDAQSAFGSASDILNVIPSVDVDADGVISLRGDANVLVLIDGKPSTQFQGSAAGVINIIMRKRRAQGASGTLQGSLGSGARYVAATNLSYGGEKGSASLSAGFRQDYRDRKGRFADHRARTEFRAGSRQSQQLLGAPASASAKRGALG
jgi:outer membrane receptor for ferrienterochelin and colicin